ncbi:hypothetical protein KSF_039430 [Reticulibacter mediterranei]|uniref:DsbA family protein n=1 Tax=Reticulibacter mediterranei TaxID=2778369 RepID=A0A8J3N367_9CHLR|nr:DsbA family protein [Reticulibacter mediterranei]GHO93895.1 hypothetical protein KSF_039430 [Reticulibacter mediterranei]
MSIHEQMEAMPDRHVEGNNEAGEQALVQIEYFTDPLCSWSWAFEVQWRRLRYECAERLNWRYRMGGLIADWRSYDDPLNDIRSPSQMGPQWFQVYEMSGMPLDDHLWQIDPPASSYPACIAVKAAERQGPTAIEEYLRRLREAVMMERRNIARRDILLAVAQETAATGLLDLDRFCADLDAAEPMDSFRQDLRDAAYYGIGRFPTLILHRYDERGIVLIGYRPYDALRSAIEHLVPGITQQTSSMSSQELTVAYVTRWRRVVARELMEVLDYDNLDQVQAMLQSLVANGTLLLADDTPSDEPIYMSRS